MKKGSTLFLRGALCLMGLAVLAICFAITTVLHEAGYYRLVLIGVLVSALPFFVALFQTFKLLVYIDRNQAFSELSVQALKNIRYCAITISGLYTAWMPLIVFAADRDDAPGVVAIGLVIVFASAVVAVFAAVLQKLLHNAIVLKSESDLTV